MHKNTKAGLRLLLATLTFLGLLSACSTSPTGRRQFILVPDTQMDAMGVAAFDQLKSQGSVSSDPSANAYVQCLADHITAELEGDWRKGWEVLVFDDPTPNAFALPGKKIGVHTGMFQIAENQDQLAAVMGHEVGHVLAKHGAERVSQSTLLEGGLGAAGSLFGGGQKAQIAMGALGLGAQYGVQLPHSRKHESEADTIGLDLMAKAGFRPEESVKLWQNMGAAGGGQPPEFMSTHPSHSTRIKGLNDGMTSAKALYSRATQSGKRPQCRAPSGVPSTPSASSTSPSKSRSSSQSSSENSQEATTVKQAPTSSTTTKSKSKSKSR